MKLAMTVTVKAMDNHRWVWRIHLFHFKGTSSHDSARSESGTRSRALRFLSRQPGRCDAELLRILGVQSLEAADLHGIGPDDPSEGLTGEVAIQHVEADVPAGGAHRDESALDVGPQRQARAAAGGFELPAHVEAAPVVLERVGRVGPRHARLGHVFLR